jgi:hypothetical protein
MTTVSKAAAGLESNKVEGSDDRGISAFLSKTAAVAAYAMHPRWRIVSSSPA